ncbi:MAG: aspartoacylase [Fibrobacterales bacterium]
MDHLSPLTKIAIVGGTHGNELTGVNLIKKWDRNPTLIERDSFCTTTTLANHDAIKACRRYIEKDLNRCFKQSDLNDPSLITTEEHRAKEINTELGPKGSPHASDIILDLHNTTANMGISLIIGQKDPALLQILSKLSSNPLVYIYYMAEGSENSPYLPSIAQRDICVESGPQAHGSLIADLYFETEQVVYAALDAIESLNNNESHTPQSVDIYTQQYNVDFPRDEQNEPNAMIHPNLQGKDYQPLHPGDPIFLTFDGEELLYEGTETVYPVFINELAYYEKGIAFSVTQKSQEIF